MLKQIAGELARALLVLALAFLCFAPLPATAAPAGPQQLGAASIVSLTSLCGGGHAQTPLACHAPDGCCRPGAALLPPRQPRIEPAYGDVDAVLYAVFFERRLAPVTSPLFRSRAPPIALVPA